MLSQDKTAFILIDVQGRLAQIMHHKEALFSNIKIMIQAAEIFKLPILWVEHIPEKLGSTIPELGHLLTDHKPIPKRTFSAWGNAGFMEALKAAGKKDLLISGIETHICVYQTAIDLIKMGYNIHILTDCVGSRYPGNKRVGLEKIKDAGGILTSVETALFEIMRSVDHPCFKQIINLIK